MFTKNRTEITSEQAVQELLADPISPWYEYRSRGPNTKNQVAASCCETMIFVLSSFIQLSGGTGLAARLRAAQFEDAFARFLPHEPNIRTLAIY